MTSGMRITAGVYIDLLMANGVPEEMIAEAAWCMTQVNAVWEDIRSARGFA